MGLVNLLGLSPVNSRPLASHQGRKLALNYDGRVFRTVSNSNGGDVGRETTFRYRQAGDVVWATYEGGSILFGTLLARVDSGGNLDMRYEHLLRDGTFKTGRCASRPEFLADGRLRVHERWEWTGGADGQGASLIEEISSPAEPDVWVFFYGSYMNLKVLGEVDLVPGRWRVATLSGFDIRICPRANLVRSEKDCVYGVVATAKHRELDRLYAHAKDVLGETYLPQAVISKTIDGEVVPALCYIAPDMRPAPAEPAYVDRIVAPAEEFGFPVWYVDRLRGFRGGVATSAGQPRNAADEATAGILEPGIDRGEHGPRWPS